MYSNFEGTTSRSYFGHRDSGNQKLGENGRFCIKKLLIRLNSKTAGCGKLKFEQKKIGADEAIMHIGFGGTTVLGAEN